MLRWISPPISQIYPTYRGLLHVRCRKRAYREHQVVAVVLPTALGHGHFPDPFSNLNFQKQLATFSRLDVHFGTFGKTTSPCLCPVHVLNKPSQVSKHSGTMVLAEAAKREQICFIFFPPNSILFDWNSVLLLFFSHYHERVRAAWCFNVVWNPHTPQVFLHVSACLCCYQSINGQLCDTASWTMDSIFSSQVCDSVIMHSWLSVNMTHLHVTVLALNRM